MEDFDYITIEADDTRPPAQKTGRWWVRNKRHHDVLGRIRWSGSWRCYVFEPSGPSIYSAGCLRDVASFIEGEMEKRRG
jgi:hypothetical protein